VSWPKVKLRELVTLTGGHAFKSGDFEASGIPLIRIGTANSGTFKTSDFVFLPQEYKSKYSKYLVRPKDLLITLTGTVGKGDYGNVCEATDGYESYLLNQRVAKININSRDLSKRYLYLFLATPEVKKNLTSLSRGVRQANIKNEDILNLEIPLPPLDEQKRIAAILDKANAIRRKRQQAIQLADDFLRSVFLDMFGDPVTNPKDFPIGTIRDFVETANYGSSGKASETEGEYPMLRMGNITYEGAWDFTNLKYIDLSEKDKPKYLTQKGDLLFNRTNSKELVGKTAVFEEEKPMAIAGYLIRVRTNELGNNYYLSGYLNSAHGKKTLVGMCKSIVGMANINAQELQNIKILLPPIELQNEFEMIVKTTKQKVKSFNRSSELLNDNFNSLSQKAFAGEL